MFSSSSNSLNHSQFGKFLKEIPTPTLNAALKLFRGDLIVLSNTILSEGAPSSNSGSCTNVSSSHVTKR